MTPEQLATEVERLTGIRAVDALEVLQAAALVGAAWLASGPGTGETE